MAEKLQKTLQSPQGIASVGSPVGPDTSKASAVQSATQLLLGGVQVAEGARLQTRKAELREGQDELGGEIDAIRRGVALENTTERFKRLKMMNEQGLLSDSAVNIEAEKELKRVIGTTPGFGDALRQEAAKILGFDPTGSYTQSLFGKTGRTSASRPLTARQKLLQEAGLMAEFTGMTQDAAAGLIMQTKANKLRADMAVSQVAAGQAGVDQLTSAHLARADEFIMDAMGNILATVGKGGLKNPEALSGAINIKKQEMFSAISRSAAEAGVTMDRVKVKAQVDAAFTGMDEMISSGTMQKIMERNVKELTAAASIIGFETFGHLSVMEAAGGQVMVKAYLDGLLNIQDEGQLALMAKIDPSLAAALGNKKLMADKWSAAWSKIMNVPLPVGVNAEQATPAMIDVVTQITIKNEQDPETRNRMLEGLRQRGQKFKDYSQYAQPGARALVTPEEVNYIVTNWGVDKPALLARVGATLSQNPGVALEVVGNKIRVKAAARTAPGNFGLGRETNVDFVPAGIELDVARLNSMDDMVKSGWANDVGEDATSFLSRALNEINTLGADATEAEPDGLADAMASFEASPSIESLEGIRSIDPDMADRIAASAAARTFGGQTNGE